MNVQGRHAVLIVEDEVLLRMAIADRLRDSGYKVIEAANAHEAIEVLRIAATVGLVLSDIRMPGSIDGVGLARLIRSEYPDMKVILTSDHLPVVDWVEHDGYFRKPYDFEAVVRLVTTLLARDCSVFRDRRAE